ncbi:MAG TPA: FAD-dependent oxidoreductase [Candidatus Acidoferrum sp.]|jgi:2-polyprenyl-6-methoxyphenol hydroxylase-like FAD-dependent oxidoreductase|nr:FAD-dependent oxidoreductase [Candidatus Acidoferrum sp.]
MSETARVRCCIAGGGPAGMMLGLLLARAGVDVVVLEKHADFLRDFRGDTIHPSTLEVVHELGLLEEFLTLPHQEIRELRAQVGDVTLKIADFGHLPTRCPFIAFMPQWDFLAFLARHASAYPTFQLRTRTEATGLLEEDGRIAGVEALAPEGRVQIGADLVVAADGRHSVLRDRAGLSAETLGAPMDVLWFRLPRTSGDPANVMGRFDPGRIFITLNRGEYWQCGFVIAKGSLEALRARGLDAFRREVARLAPYAAARIDAIRSWDDVKLLTVQVDRLRRWSRPGLLCIGDAAHAMSPIGGVGINLAIQDAVAAANRLAVPLAERRVTTDDLTAVQRRRELPTRVTQQLQLTVQRRAIARVLTTRAPLRPPALVRLLARVPLFWRLPARLIGIGVRPEHVRSPAQPAARTIAST